MHGTVTNTGTAARNTAAGPVATLGLVSLGLAPWIIAASRILSGDWLLVPVLAFGCGAAVSAAFLYRGWTAPRLGPANVLTLGRLALAMLLFVPLVRPSAAAEAGAWVFLGLAVVTLALDGVDGSLARHSGLAGPWGARFDMEVDAVFALLLAAVAWRLGAAGPWVILLGGMRYLFVLAALVFPWLAAPLPPRLRRKIVCVVQIGTLAALIAPVVVPPWSVLAAVAALALLGWSFAIDVVWLARRR